MTPEELRGEWAGRFAGTNTGRLYLRLTPVVQCIVVEAKLDDDAVGPAYLLGTGTVADDTLTARLVSRDPANAAQFGTVDVIATAPAAGSLVGSWVTSAGTRGDFTLSPSTPLPAPQQPPPATPPARISFFEKTVRTRACAVNLDVLRRVHAVLKEAAAEAASLHERKQYAPVPEGPAELQRRYRVMVIIRGAQGELTAMDDIAAIEPDVLPYPLTSVEFNIGFNYKAATGNEAFNRAIIRFDFTRPPAFDISIPSSEPTPNSSIINILGADTLWVAGSFERVNAIICQTAVNSSWLHRKHAYDVLVSILGFPLAILLGALAGTHVPLPSGVNGQLIQLGVAFFVGLLTLMALRIAFSLIRWLLPYIEYVPSPEPLHRRIRVLLAGGIFTIVTGVLGSLIYSLF